MVRHVADWQSPVSAPLGATFRTVAADAGAASANAAINTAAAEISPRMIPPCGGHLPFLAWEAPTYGGHWGSARPLNAPQLIHQQRSPALHRQPSCDRQRDERRGHLVGLVVEQAGED